MADKVHMPRMREQYKDNAIEVDKNLPDKNKLRKERVVDKTKDEEELEECLSGNPNGTCGCGCGCSYL